MILPDYNQTLERFGLDVLKVTCDLVLDDNGNIAKTRDGDLQFGAPKHNALFRLVERWRVSQPTIDSLFGSLKQAKQQRLELLAQQDLTPLSINPGACYATTEYIAASDHAAGAVGGALAVLLNNLLTRLKLDLKASGDVWNSAGPLYAGNSIGKVMDAAAANFRHHDEWACFPHTTGKKEKALPSMSVLCQLLHLPVFDDKGVQTLRTNVCGDVLMTVTGGSIEKLHEDIFVFAKAVAKL